MLTGIETFTFIKVEMGVGTQMKSHLLFIMNGELDSAQHHYNILQKTSLKLIFKFLSLGGMEWTLEM